MQAPPRVTLSPERGLFDSVFVRRCPAPAQQAKMHERTENVIENKGQSWGTVGTWRQETDAQHALFEGVLVVSAQDVTISG
jgi:hypothetical protein